MDECPVSASAQVSGANWLEAPLNRWSMWNVGQLVPTRKVSRGNGPVMALPQMTAPPELGGLELKRVDGTTGTVDDVLADTFTDAYAVLQDGALVAERYAADGGPDTVHAVLSVTKAMVGCVAGVLVDRGDLDDHRAITDYVPELASTGYAGATVRHVLDMRSGVAFLEDYTDPHAEIRVMDKWLHGGRGLYAFLQTLEHGRDHGGRFLYRSAETDVLGWVCERAAGSRMTDLLSELLWKPMGAEYDAEIICDGVGNVVHDGGLLATARDLLRLGQLLLNQGSVRLTEDEPQRVLPLRWLRQAWAVDADIRTAFAESPAESSFPGGWYRNQFWFRVGDHGTVLLCIGIHGQMVYVSRRTGTVCVKLSGWPDAQAPSFLQDTLRAFDAISGSLTGAESTVSGPGLPGVVSGLSRGGRERPRG